MTRTACKFFEIEEWTVDNAMFYRIEVRFRGELINVFEAKTKGEAQQAFAQAGYEYAPGTTN